MVILLNSKNEVVPYNLIKKKQEIAKKNVVKKLFHKSKRRPCLYLNNV